MLEMQRVRREALRPVWVTIACWTIFTALPTWVAQAVAGFTLSLLAHSGLVAPAAALIIALQVPEAPTTKFIKSLFTKVLSLLQLVTLREFLMRQVSRAISALTTTLRYCQRIFREACRDPRRLTRADYTRTKVLQRRLLGMPRQPSYKRPQKSNRCRRPGSKRAQKSAGDRVAHIIRRLQADAAKARRDNPGLEVVTSPEAAPEQDLDNRERSWRSLPPRPSNIVRWTRSFLTASIASLTLSLLLSMLVLPVALGAGGTGAAVGLGAANGFVNYQAAEVQAQQKAELAQLKLQPYDADALAQRFAHSIESHLPDGVRTKPDPSEYWKDPVTKLTLHKLPHLSEVQFQELVKVVRKHADGVVAYTLQQITGYTGSESALVIELDTDRPIFQPPRRNYSTAELDICDEKCEDLLASGVVRELKHSNYACNAVLAAKRAPDGTWSDKRFCINFIPINKHTELDRYGSHRAEDLFQKVVNAKYMTALDLRSGFHQIPIKEEDISKAAFWWVSNKNQPPKLLAYQRMPFGLKNAPAKFQRVMDTELRLAGCSEFAFAYIDDLLIASNTWEEHVVHVDRVLQMLTDCNLRIHPDKSVFGTNIVEYLGHNVIGEYGITMNDAKVEAIKVLPDPTNVSELRSILGFLSYYRHFIPGFSSLAAPMTKLLHKDQPWDWGSEQQAAYRHLKQLMTQPGRVLRPIDKNRPLILHTDWSNHGIGAVLGQVDDDGLEYLCACASRSLNKHEKNYPSYKGELLALAWAVRSFRTHVHGTKFKLVTDHQPLTWLMKAQDLTGQYSRWQMLVQEYDFEICHRAGDKHQNADVLSRFPRATTEDFTGARMDVVDADRVMALSQQAGYSPWLCPHCPDHGHACPGKAREPRNQVITCPEHGPSCTSKSCAKLLEQQYTWHAAKKQWEDPKECRDTCMECCTEALNEHPLKDESCSHICHKTCGLPPPDPLVMPYGLQGTFRNGKYYPVKRPVEPVVGFQGNEFEEIQPSKPLPTSTIDSFAPSFSSFIQSNSGFLGRDCYQNNGLREPFEDLQDDELGEHSRLEEHQQAAVMMTFSVTAARSRLVMEVPPYVEEHTERLAVPPTSDQAVLDRGIISESFFPHATTTGVTLVELCAGIGSGLEAVLLNGWKVNRYFYVDIDPVARDIARFRVANLSARFTNQFPPTAWAEAFSLPHDLNAIRDFQLDNHFARRQEQILVMAGWPCQDYSPAGRGKPGARAAILDKVISIIARLQAVQHAYPVGYMLENVALQENFNHAHVRNEVAQEVFSKVGTPIKFDAADVGSYASRVRNYWTNLSSQLPMQKVYDELKLPHKGSLYDILQPGRHPMPVTQPSRGGHNVIGKVRSVLPTLMSYRKSRAFRPGKAGSIYSEAQQAFGEPMAVERELAMGYEPGTTAAPEVDEGERCSALGQAMDLNALFSIFHLAYTLYENRLAHVGAQRTRPRRTPKGRVLTFQIDDPPRAMPGDRSTDSSITQPEKQAHVGDSPTDVWNDGHVISYLKEGKVPKDPGLARRVARRSQSYRWYNNRLYKVDTAKGEPISYRMIPPPSERDSTINRIHIDLGHLGEKRTIYSMSSAFWWYGMTLDIKRVIAGCKVCQRAKASGPPVQRDMQTISPDHFGIFHRWGIDHAVELPTSSNGNKHCLLCIDYYSKWIEAIPVKDLEAETTLQAFLLHVIARYGMPAEVISDNGTAFKGEFRDFCTRRLIHQRLISEDTPRSNGLAERAVQTIKNALRKFAAQKHHALDWDSHGLAAILTGYRLTPQAASKHSPARIVFALDPVLDAEQHIARMGPLDYMNPDDEVVTAELMKRVQYVKELGHEVAHNLRTAHERDCRRFKARRAGYYIPRVHHFIAGDYVFIKRQGKKHGGTLGMRALDAVVRVVEVKDSGVLTLVNQAGLQFDKHMEHCVPCGLPNLLGDTYAGLVMPPEEHPCQVCREHNHWDIMLLCDNCDSGWHTYCLSPPLDEVPDGKWICPDCTTHGVTLDTLAAKESRYVESERSRPDLELPGRSRVAKARRLAEEWHGAPVKQVNQGKTRLGRVYFQGILKPKWFRIDWENGTSSEHMAHIFRHLERVDEDDLPSDFPPRPDPVLVTAIRPIPSINGPGGWHKVSADHIGLSGPDWLLIDTLLRTEQFRGVAALQYQTVRGSSRPYFDLGHPDPKSHVQQFPAADTLRSGLQYLLTTGARDLVFVTPHMALNADLMDITLLYTPKVMCTKVRRSWIQLGLLQSSWFGTLQYIGQLLVCQEVNPPSTDDFCWLFAFPATRRKNVLRFDIPSGYTWVFFDVTKNTVTSMSCL
jgi:site-specific DNA-cytosine methylase